jgi:hypothetical protein
MRHRKWRSFRRNSTVDFAGFIRTARAAIRAGLKRMKLAQAPGADRHVMRKKTPSRSPKTKDVMQMAWRPRHDVSRRHRWLDRPRRPNLL